MKIWTGAIAVLVLSALGVLIVGCADQAKPATTADNQMPEPSAKDGGGGGGGW